MSVERLRSGRDSAVEVSRLALAVGLTAIVASFCLTALLVRPLSASSEGAERAPSAPITYAVRAHSGYGIDE